MEDWAFTEAGRRGGFQQPSGCGGHNIVTVVSECTGTTESFEPLEEPLARQIVADAIDRYLIAVRKRIVPFVNDHFSFSGTSTLHRQAIGWDLVRAPVNLALSVPQVGLLLGSSLARRAGWQRQADWLGDQRLVLLTDVARELDWLIHTELLQLPYRRGTREATRDALAEEVFSDPRIETTSYDILKGIKLRAADADFRKDLESKLAVYTASRAAASELTASMLSVAIGAAVFKQLTPGPASLGPALAMAAAQHGAVASFPLGAGLGNLWYSVFPVAPGLAATLGVTSGLALAFSVLSAFAGVLADPVQRGLGLHQRRLRRLVDAIERDLSGEGPGHFVVRDHYVARVLDLADLLRAAWRALN